MKLIVIVGAVVTIVVMPSASFSADRQHGKPPISNVLKQSYTQGTGDLKNSAARVRHYNNQKKQIRDAASKKRSTRRKKG